MLGANFEKKQPVSAFWLRGSFVIRRILSPSKFITSFITNDW
jgi:hypothetical protein